MAQENSFDIVCKIDLQEVDNAIQQVMKEIRTRYDFKGSSSEVRRDNQESTCWRTTITSSGASWRCSASGWRPARFR